MWNFLEPQVVETRSDHTNKTNKYLYHPNNRHDNILRVIVPTVATTTFYIHFIRTAERRLYLVLSTVVHTVGGVHSISIVLLLIYFLLRPPELIGGGFLQ